MVGGWLGDGWGMVGGGWLGGMVGGMVGGVLFENYYKCVFSNNTN